MLPNHISLPFLTTVGKFTLQLDAEIRARKWHSGSATPVLVRGDQENGVSVVDISAIKPTETQLESLEAKLLRVYRTTRIV